MGSCCSATAASPPNRPVRHRRHGSGGGGGGQTGGGGSGEVEHSSASLSTRSRNRRTSAEKLETVTEEKDSPVLGVRHAPEGAVSAPHVMTGRGARTRDGLLTSSTTARTSISGEYPLASHAADEQRDMDQVLLTIPFFDTLDTKHVKILRSFFTRRVYAPREVVLAEGLPLGQQVFHIIINGRVEMCAKDPEGRRTVLQQFGPGQWFGELTWNASLDQIQPVTVYALQSTTILYTSSHQFAAALQQFPQLGVAINIHPDAMPDVSSPSSAYTASSPDGPRSLGIGAPIQIQLRSIPFFADIDELKLQQLAMLCEVRKRKAGAWICRQGAEADGFFYIISGRVEVSAHGFMDVDSLMSSAGGDIAGQVKAAQLQDGKNGAADRERERERERERARQHHRGSGNSLHTRVEDSPVGAKSARGGTVLLAPNTPLTQGMTPSPPSTPNRFSPKMGSTTGRRSLPVNQHTAVHIHTRGRGGSFSASARDSEHARERGGSMYDEHSSEATFDEPPMGTTSYLDTLRAGDSFGEISLISMCARTASVQATADCILLYLSRERFARFLQFAPSIRTSGLFTDLIRKRTANSLKCLPIFAPLKVKTVGPHHQFDEARLALLGAMFKYLSVPANTNIFNEGDFGMAFYIVIQGTCLVTAKAPDGHEEIFLNELHANDYFGEASLIHRVRCNATVKTKTNCLLLKLNGENFLKFLQVAPEVESLFRQRVNMRTSERLRTIPFFRNVRENKPWSKLDLLGALFTFEEFAHGELIFSQGTIGTKFYIITNGEVEISVAKEAASGESGTRQVLEVLTQPNHFGEVALMRATARTATARCVSTNGTVLLSIDSTRFRKFLAIAPELTEDFARLLIHRTSNLLKSFDLFRQVQENKPWNKIEMIASLFEYELVEPGQSLYKLGDTADKFFVVASGAVRLESRWAGVQTMHSQSAFGATELMRNRQNDQLYKQAKAKLEKEVQRRKELAMTEDGAAIVDALPPLVEPTPPVAVRRTHAAKAVELCGLMTMSVVHFRSLLTIAPEITPYFQSLAAHDHRRVSEIGVGALNSTEGSPEDSLDTPKKDSISALVLPPPSSDATTLAQAQSRVDSPAPVVDRTPSSSLTDSPPEPHRGTLRPRSSLINKRLASEQDSPYNPFPHGGMPMPPVAAFPSLTAGSDSPELRAEEAALDAAATRLHHLMTRVPSPPAHDLTDLGHTSPPPPSRKLALQTATEVLTQAPSRTAHISPHARATVLAPMVLPPTTTSSQPAVVFAPTPVPAFAGLPAFQSGGAHPFVSAHAPAVAPAVAPAAPQATFAPTSPVDDEESGKAWLLASNIVIIAPTPVATPTQPLAPVPAMVVRTAAAPIPAPVLVTPTPVPAPAPVPATTVLAKPTPVAAPTAIRAPLAVLPPLVLSSAVISPRPRTSPPPSIPPPVGLRPLSSTPAVVPLILPTFSPAVLQAQTALVAAALPTQTHAHHPTSQTAARKRIMVHLPPTRASTAWPSAVR